MTAPTLTPHHVDRPWHAEPVITSSRTDRQSLDRSALARELANIVGPSRRRERVVESTSHWERPLAAVTLQSGHATTAATDEDARIARRWALALGQFHERSGVAIRLGITQGEVHKRAIEGKLLELTTADGIPVYPVFQFDGAEILAGLDEVLKPFRDAGPFDGWTVASWLSAADEALSGRSVIQWLAEGQPHRLPVTLARLTAARWSE